MHFSTMNVGNWPRPEIVGDIEAPSVASRPVADLGDRQLSGSRPFLVKLNAPLTHRRTNGVLSSIS
jgi:hypothetical protein